MSELSTYIPRRHFPAWMKLSAIRDRLINKLDFSESSRETRPQFFPAEDWLRKYKSRIMSKESYKHLSLPVHAAKGLLSMMNKKRQEPDAYAMKWKEKSTCRSL